MSFPTTNNEQRVSSVQVPVVAREVPPPPIWVNPDCYTKSLLTCNICWEIPFDPIVTPCDHIFCRKCLLQSLRQRKCCPNDRTRISSSKQLKTIDGTTKRIWSEIPVKCPTCLIWTGSFGSYQREHGPNCVDPQKRVRELEAKLQDVESKLRTVQDEAATKVRLVQEHAEQTLRSTVDEAKSVVQQIQTTLNTTCATAQQMQSSYEDKILELEAQLKQMTTPPPHPTSFVPQQQQQMCHASPPVGRIADNIISLNGIKRPNERERNRYEYSPAEQQQQPEVIQRQDVTVTNTWSCPSTTTIPMSHPSWQPTSNSNVDSNHVHRKQQPGSNVTINRVNISVGSNDNVQVTTTTTTVSRRIVRATRPQPIVTGVDK